MSNYSPSLSPVAAHEAAPLDWFLAVFREVIIEVKADDQPAMNKAAALTRLGSLYLKAYDTAERSRAKAEKERWNAVPEAPVANREERLPSLGVEVRAGGETVSHPAHLEPEASPPPIWTKTANPSKPRSRGKSRHNSRPHGRPARAKR